MLIKIWDTLKQIFLLSYSHILTSLYCILKYNYLKYVNEHLNMLNGIDTILLCKHQSSKGICSISHYF